MDTNWKKGKRIRSFWYQMITSGAFLTVIILGIAGRDAIKACVQSGLGVFSGEVYDLPEFREYMGELCYEALLGYAGIGDDNGYPLTDENANDYSKKALKEYQKKVKALKSDIFYHLEIPVKGAADSLISNITYPIFSEYDGHLILPDSLMVCCYWNGPEEYIKLYEYYYNYSESYFPLKEYCNVGYQPNKYVASDMKMVIAINKNYKSNLMIGWAAEAKEYQQKLILFASALGVFVLFGLLSVFTREDRKYVRRCFAKGFQRIFLEGKLLVMGSMLFIFFFFHLWSINTINSLIILLYFPIGCLAYLLYVDCVENGREFGKCSIVRLLIAGFREEALRKPWYLRARRYSRSLVLGGSLLILVGGAVVTLFCYKQITRAYYIWISYKLLSIVIILGILICVLGIVMMCRYMGMAKLLSDMEVLAVKIDEMREGRMGSPYKLFKNSLLQNTAIALDELEKGMERAIEEQNRSNRMKVELITNVSHDLKTPLTSIINYAELLCDEELDTKAKEYALALQSKAYRLKNMVQDVFELSKATSGNLSVDISTLDLVKLIKQTLADMDEQIKESSLSFKLRTTSDAMMIAADGDKLYRVFQNLFVNALQYSLENSRVHIQMTEENGYALVKVKNTSSAELALEPSEMIERFVRADSSRTTEGSGLGLSIVQSFVEACQGEFMVETDADMFVACVRLPMLPKIEEKPEEEILGDET